MLEKYLCPKVWVRFSVHHFFPYSFFSTGGKKKISQAPNQAQLNTPKTEKNKNSTLLHVLEGTLLNMEGPTCYPWRTESPFPCKEYDSIQIWVFLKEEAT